MSPRHDLEQHQNEIDRPASQHSELGVATLWLAFYVLLITGALTTHFRAGSMIAVANAVLE
jgi:uncharacterized membrane protein